MLLNDRQAETVWRDILTFAEDPTAPLPSKAPPIPWVPARQAAGPLVAEAAAAR
jgi:hypothetical protein